MFPGARRLNRVSFIVHRLPYVLAELKVIGSRVTIEAKLVVIERCKDWVAHQLAELLRLGVEGSERLVDAELIDVLVLMQKDDWLLEAVEIPGQTQLATEALTLSNADGAIADATEDFLGALSAFARDPVDLLEQAPDALGVRR